jgi:uncharacterized protein (DUF58 family)
LELSPFGRHIAWVGAGLLIVGLLFSNALLILSVTLLLLYLLFEAFSFHGAIENAKDSIKLVSHPSNIETSVGRSFRIESLITNSSASSFRIVQLSRNLPPQVDQEKNPPFALPLPGYREQMVDAFLSTKIPGKYEINSTTILLERRTGLFRKAVEFPDNMIIVVQPQITRPLTPIETDVLDDLARDSFRRGSGTDLAGIRPFNPHDDFHRIDWKATARAGRLMTRDFYLEKDPTIILMIDVSCSMKATKNGVPPLNVLLGEVENLLAFLHPETPVGLKLFDERQVHMEIEPISGVEKRRRVIRALLEQATPSSTPMHSTQQTIRQYRDFAMEAGSLMRELAFTAKNDPRSKRFASFAGNILPFLSKAKRNHLDRLRTQGVFKAFERACSLSEPVLVFVISNGTANLDGLYEGARNAGMSNHRVVLAILSSPSKASPIERLSGLARFGVRISGCTPQEISGVLGDEILEISHGRRLRMIGSH